MKILFLLTGCLLAALSSAAGTRPERTMNFDETKVRPYSLEDPLMFTNGAKVTRETWPMRRREILGIMAHGLYGTEPPKAEALEIEERTNVVVCAGFAACRHYRQWFRRDRSGPSVDWTVWLPNRPLGDGGAHPKAGVPVVLFLNYEGNDVYAENSPGFRMDSRRYLPLQAILARGYAVMTAHYEQIAPDDVDAMDEGVLRLWPRTRADAPRAPGPGRFRADSTSPSAFPKSTRGNPS